MSHDLIEQAAAAALARVAVRVAAEADRVMLRLLGWNVALDASVPEGYALVSIDGRPGTLYPLGKERKQ